MTDVAGMCFRKVCVFFLSFFALVGKAKALYYFPGSGRLAASAYSTLSWFLIGRILSLATIAARRSSVGRLSSGSACGSSLKASTVLASNFFTSQTSDFRVRAFQPRVPLGRAAVRS